MESKLVKRVCRHYLDGKCYFNKRCRSLHIDETEGTKELLQMVRDMPHTASAGSVAARRPSVTIGSKKGIGRKRGSAATRRRSVARKAALKRRRRSGKGTSTSSPPTSVPQDVIPTQEVALPVLPPGCGIEDLLEEMDIQEDQNE
ncbi:uncharacterized protein LOC135818976 [Sycon ciliatum]|uniref:uncharacterized protein LOC135818976 n=1 Tax=Sycon ciliatum TaxID=27933 RepID=UPI0031F62418